MLDAEPFLVQEPCALKVGHARISLNGICYLSRFVNNLILQSLKNEDKKGTFCALCSF